MIAFAIHHLRNTDLDDLDAACQARTTRKFSQLVQCVLENITHVSQYRTAPPPILSLPASSSAFSSACRQRHVFNPAPPAAFELHLGQPPSLQFVTLLGVPLYPVLITRFSLTTTQPTGLRMQLLRRAASEASVMKYMSHVGRMRAGSGKSMASSALYSSGREVDAFNNRIWALDCNAARPARAS